MCTHSIITPRNIDCCYFDCLSYQVIGPDSAIYSSFPDHPDEDHRLISQRLLQALGLACQAPLALPPSGGGGAWGKKENQSDDETLERGLPRYQLTSAAGPQTHAQGDHENGRRPGLIDVSQQEGAGCGPGQRSRGAEASGPSSQVADAAVTVSLLHRGAIPGNDPSLASGAVTLKRGREDPGSNLATGPSSQLACAGNVTFLHGTRGTREAMLLGAGDPAAGASEATTRTCDRVVNNNGGLLRAAALSGLEDIEL